MGHGACCCRLRARTRARRRRRPRPRIAACSYYLKFRCCRLSPRTLACYRCPHTRTTITAMPTQVRDTVPSVPTRDPTTVVSFRTRAAAACILTFMRGGFTRVPTPVCDSAAVRGCDSSQTTRARRCSVPPPTCCTRGCCCRCLCRTRCCCRAHTRATNICVPTFVSGTAVSVLTLVIAANVRTPALPLQLSNHVTAVAACMLTPSSTATHSCMLIPPASLRMCSILLRAMLTAAGWCSLPFVLTTTVAYALAPAPVTAACVTVPAARITTLLRLHAHTRAHAPPIAATTCA